MVSRRVNALAHQVTLLMEPNKSRCFAMEIATKLEAADICHHEPLALAATNFALVHVCTNEKNDSFT